MTAHRPMRLHGQRIAGPAGSLSTGPGHQLMNDPRRGCAPGNLNTDPDIFFSSHPPDVALAKEFCKPCIARYACVAYALDHDEKRGVWGGYDMSSVAERRAAAEGRTPPPRRTAAVKTIRGATREEMKTLREQQVRELWEQKLPDTTIALKLDLHPGAVNQIRRRLGLPALYGPAGKRIRREQVNA